MTDNKATILIVDDEEKNIKLLKAILSMEGFSIRRALDGKTALDMVAQKHPDLILLDVMMPGINGFDVCRKLKENESTRTIPILMVTALKEKKDRLMAIEAGADDFLSKPIDAIEIQVRVKSLLRIKRYYDQLAAKNIELQEKNNRLKELENKKEALYHMIVHDLRSPLSAIKGALEVIMLSPSDDTPEERNDLIDVSLQGCRDLTRLIDSLLEIHRIENTGMNLKLNPVDWWLLNQSLKTAFTVKAEAKGLHLVFSIAATTDEVCGDHTVLTRIISNLLENAIRHTPAGGHVELFAKPHPDKRFFQIGVKDTGEGITAQHQEKIFDRFEQLAENSERACAGAAGLGLTFCKLAVEAHGGRIWVESGGIGKGAAFMFTLPVTPTCQV